ncbi:serine O-acetyltransferase [Litoreibacter ascidiaceicola]|uniref:serine O-acetyltransferase n=1 Tax=Litoreibacter ascidiaceicola TaxID=1486859 RepID=A0A1M4ZKB0_9RHOB|nr:serine acetyltransferase [Litoreibacter ascidiaceicola]SHF18431.1 serine O-acetyltransferase [Litoreibacter ascidiaceicola]
MKLVDDVRAVLEASPEVAEILALGPFEGFHDLAGNLLSSLCKAPAIRRAVTEAYRDKALAKITAFDITETARRNFEPGGAASALLFSRGVQAIMGHRVAHKYWVEGDTTMALALKAAFGRAFSTDIHPAAQIGAGLWLDHGLGFVVGETSIIEDDVSIWHNVTLGSTLTNSGPRRHPHIGTGAVIGAGAILLGNIKIGAHANVAAGAVVVQDVAQNALVVGAKATVRGDAKVSFVEREGIRK